MLQFNFTCAKLLLPSNEVDREENWKRTRNERYKIAVTRRDSNLAEGVYSQKFVTPVLYTYVYILPARSNGARFANRFLVLYCTGFIYDLASPQPST